MFVDRFISQHSPVNKHISPLRKWLPPIDVKNRGVRILINLGYSLTVFSRQHISARLRRLHK